MNEGKYEVCRYTESVSLTTKVEYYAPVKTKKGCIADGPYDIVLIFNAYSPVSVPKYDKLAIHLATNGFMVAHVHRPGQPEPLEYCEQFRNHIDFLYEESIIKGTILLTI